MGLEEDVGAAQGPQGEQAAEGSSSAEALAAAGQIMQLEGEARGCLDRLDELEQMLSKQKQAFDIAEVAAAARLSVPAAAHSSSPPSSSHPTRRFGHASSVSDLDAQIAAAKADLAAHGTREVQAKARFKEMEESIAASEQHLAALEVMSVQTPGLMGMEP
mmetsp:Transcript_15096/g.37102  ORF Transcript_15096/g.37102 Transcript_15096/m.37102 type:complete len:161 (-) Transcript_15096:279-761(-)